MHKFLLALSLFSFFLAPLSYSVDFDESPVQEIEEPLDSDGGTCGAGWSRRWVRDRWMAADFTAACREHDDCYASCGASQRKCDKEFYWDMRRACSKAYNSAWHTVQRNRCLNIADVYFKAVRAYGKPIFKKTQNALHCD